MALSKSKEELAEKNRKYWRDREDEQLKHNITEEKEYNKQIKLIYQNMLDNINKDIESFYSKYAGKEGITLAEAKKRVSKLDIEAYERKAAKYVKEKNFSKKANEEMRLYNAAMKINRLELLKAEIGLETIAGHDELEKYLADILEGRTMDELKRQAGILGETVLSNSKKAHAIVNGSFHTGTFSDRIWQYQELMRDDLGGILARGLIQGKNPRALAKDLRKYWYGNDPLTGGGATYCMERLMRTELARVQTEAQKQSFERNGFDMYMFIVNGDCCDICKEKANKDIGMGKGVYKVADMMPGENAAPLHPSCRCSIAAHEDSKEYEEWLNYLANGGTTEEFNYSKAKQAKHIPVSQDMLYKRRAVSEVMKDLGAKVDEEGNVTLYHATAAENVELIKENGFKPTDAPINGGTGGETVKKRVFFAHNKEWCEETWANGGEYEIMTVKIPAEYLHQFGNNKSEVVVEGTIKENKNGVWVPDTEPTSTAWDRITVKRWKKKNQIKQ